MRIANSLRTVRVPSRTILEVRGRTVHNSVRGMRVRVLQNAFKMARGRNMYPYSTYRTLARRTRG